MSDQPPPTPNDSTPIWDLVIADMHERDRFGWERYGTPLQAGNGRDFLIDAYEEALDLVVYLRGAIEERKNNTAPDKALIERLRKFLADENESRMFSGDPEYIAAAKEALEVFEAIVGRSKP